MNKPLPQIASAINSQATARDRSVLSELTARKALEITRILQTSLDPTRLIELFSMEAGALIMHQGLRYAMTNSIWKSNSADRRVTPAHTNSISAMNPWVN